MISQKRQFASEFLSSAMIAFFGLAMVVPLCVSGFMNQFEFSILFGLLVAFDTIIFAPVSGAQFNPVVTVSMIVSGRQSVKTIVTYIAAQYLGWFFGSGMIYVVFWKQLKEFYESDSGNPVNLFFCSTEYIWTGVWVEIIWAERKMLHDCFCCFVQCSSVFFISMLFTVAVLFFCGRSGHSRSGNKHYSDFSSRQQLGKQQQTRSCYRDFIHGERHWRTDFQSDH